MLFTCTMLFEFDKILLLTMNVTSVSCPQLLLTICTKDNNCYSTKQHLGWAKRSQLTIIGKYLSNAASCFGNLSVSTGPLGCGIFIHYLVFLHSFYIVPRHDKISYYQFSSTNNYCSSRHDINFTKNGYNSTHSSTHIYIPSQASYLRIFDANMNLFTLDVLDSLEKIPDCMEMCHFPVVLAFYNVHSGYDSSLYGRSCSGCSELWAFNFYIATWLMESTESKTGFTQGKIKVRCSTQLLLFLFFTTIITMSELLFCICCGLTHTYLVLCRCYVELFALTLPLQVCSYETSKDQHSTKIS